MHFRRLAVDRAPAVPDGMPLDHLLKRGCALRIADADVFSHAVLAPHLIAVAGICGRFFSSLLGKSPLHNLAHFTQTYFSRSFRQSLLRQLDLAERDLRGSLHIHASQARGAPEPTVLDRFCHDLQGACGLVLERRQPVFEGEKSNASSWRCPSTQLHSKFPLIHFVHSPADSKSILS